MLIPIPSQNQSFSIHLYLKGNADVEIGLWVYQPHRPNTHYFRRKVKLTKGQKRHIEAPLPVTPNKLILEIFDKQSISDRAFNLVDFELKPMTSQKPWASPDRHRFMDFAIDFARKAGYLRPGFYPSRDDEFLIQYVPVITDEMGNELMTPARIHRRMPRVQLSQKLIRPLSIPVRAAILSHEGCHFFLNTRSEKQADLCGIKYYLDYGFPKVEAVYAATKVFGMHPEAIGHAHVQRTKDIIQFIDQYQKVA